MDSNQLIHLDSVPNFKDKNEIKPWLQKIFYPQGIEIVIERSDSLKVVFKCKAAKRGRKSQEELTEEERLRQEALAREHEMKRKSMGNKRCVSRYNHCPFRVRATYSLKRKKWSVVVLNNTHTHPLKFNPLSEEYKKFKEKLRADNDVDAIKMFDELEYRTQHNLPLPTSIIPCDCGLTNEVKSFDVVLPKTMVPDELSVKASEISLKKVLEEDENCTFLTNLKKSSAISKNKGVKRLKPKHSLSGNTETLRKNLLWKSNQIYYSETAVNSPMLDSSPNLFGNQLSLSTPDLVAADAGSNGSQISTKAFSDFIDDPFTVGTNGNGADFQPFTASNTGNAITNLDEIDFTNIFARSTNNNHKHPYNSTAIDRNDSPTSNAPLSVKNAYDGLDDCWSIYMSPNTTHDDTPVDISPASSKLHNKMPRIPEQRSDSLQPNVRFNDTALKHESLFTDDLINKSSPRHDVGDEFLFDKMLNKELTSLNEFTENKHSDYPVNAGSFNLDVFGPSVDNNDSLSTLDFTKPMNDNFVKLEEDHIM
ncbi:AFT1 [Nakaseomyces glabratus]|uniref:AFT1 n=1 Tax=Candida glabrata (strain ATCC 2001 / BCRC 20586 / JCM 3761 / NBRC 0622 / NRRL Y-65 / CBS 138) TaxID=284593 RepID=Q6FS49_CANGA|nr:uncharacterized protein CAGL0H03487g [Nakaseomyces glabratus]KAH7601368.1 Transcription factor AFT [Nakaseomyces glabratus]KAH7605751.1 Transcription factor AFT [Nakaseomyces glabratus]QHS66582.1 AFT1 [Nakaseomyces glabratus]CAG59878.1 unnamed protein product [Nakaseomyces glabratus]|eukprot:XP_446945.1 uncharacterized protein CAGL0H03487g [[Candida] glabrata]